MPLLVVLVGGVPPHHVDRAGVVGPVAVLELARVPAEAEPRQHQGRLTHVLLVVATVDADRVQLEDLAAVVLVRVVLRALRVVEVGHHRGVRRGGPQHVLELAQRVLADHRAVVVVPGPPARLVRVRDVQVVRPEVDHHLEELSLAPGFPHDRGLPERVHQVPRAFEGLERALHRHVEVGVAVGDVVLAEAVVHARRVELAIEPAVAPEPADLLHEVLGRTERRPPKQVQVGTGGHERAARSGRHGVEHPRGHPGSCEHAADRGGAHEVASRHGRGGESCAVVTRRHAIPLMTRGIGVGRLTP